MIDLRKKFFSSLFFGHPPARQITISVSSLDDARIQKIRDDVPTVETDEEALLWALRNVKAPDKNVAVLTGAPHGGGSGGGKRGIGISVAGLIPDVPLGETDLSHPKHFEMYVDTAVIRPAQNSGKRVRVDAAELARLRQIESQFSAFAAKAESLFPFK